eukprot:TRINITY_DN12658_c0_g1_i2.p2 TRINITY_DN12658_c0_g1~~TRINITY_DN12658_c0_g1_i2.p2  ORF type:complete len:206 (+),score=35.94 TRINITY_DN12658_c0_g1_i2:215-832(+)
MKVLGDGKEKASRPGPSSTPRAAAGGLRKNAPATPVPVKRGGVSPRSSTGGNTTPRGGPRTAGKAPGAGGVSTFNLGASPVATPQASPGGISPRLGPGAVGVTTRLLQPASGTTPARSPRRAASPDDGKPGPIPQLPCLDLNSMDAWAMEGVLAKAIVDLPLPCNVPPSVKPAIVKHDFLGLMQQVTATGMGMPALGKVPPMAQQ